MKGIKRALTLLILMIAFSAAAVYIAVSFVSKDYTQKIARLDNNIQDKFSKMEDNLREVHVTLENTSGKNKLERERAFLKIQAMKEDLEKWKKSYMQIVLELKDSVREIKDGRIAWMIETLQEDIDEFNIKIQDLDLKIDKMRGRKPVRAKAKTKDKGVDLGKISVKK